MSENLSVSYAPHIRKDRYISTTMRDVIIALIPALLGSVYFFGVRTLLVTALAVASCVASEYIWNRACGKDNSINDLSAVVTGLLLAMSLPVSVPVYIPVAGGIFAIIIVKCFFGGLGQNIVNPALAARTFLLASWPVAITDWAIDGLTGATPLAMLKEGRTNLPNLFNLFFGTGLQGSIGEVSAFLLLIGGIYLIARKVITATIPVTYLVTLGIFGFTFNPHGFFQGDFLFTILSGGAMLGAFFMATDYTTSPLTAKGQIIYAFGAAVITGVIRIYGGYPEGVTYGILIMNIVTPLIDKAVVPKTFGKAVKSK